MENGIQTKRPAGDRVSRCAADFQLFAQHYARKAQRGREPNDRRYRRDVLTKIDHMRPEQLDAMLRYGEDD